ncbi:MAG: glycine--tRNA ligase subunit beta [Candidatus Stahlbacteria bacterium]|nr:glycine--tRNA ligase subunit beta [Candidatus Stahlbacteria bacterium]
MRKNMLLEIGTEEVPAEWLKDIATQLKDKICALLKSYEISYDDYELFYTPRRIAVIIKNVATEQNDKYVEITGPPKEVAITNDNDWSEAAIGFAKAQSIPVKELKFKLKGKKEVVSCEKLVKGSKTQSILKSNLSLLISKIEFPKSMVWEITEDRRQISERFRFVRPIRWVVALFGETIIPFEMAGIKAGSEISTS